MTLPLLLKIEEGSTGPYISLQDRIGATFDNVIESLGGAISSHITSQLPDFVSQRENLFRSFIESYYEWLEQKTNVFGRTVMLRDISDIDKTIDEFVLHFKKQYLLNFPEKLAVNTIGERVDEKTLLKNIKDFYQAKGSEKSYEFLFRILYDSALEFYYPKVDILKASDGNWVEESAIKVTSINGVKNFNIAGNKVEQINRNTGKVTASARVYRVHQYNIATHEISELFLDNIVGDFTSGEKIKCKLSDGTIIEESIYGLFSEIVVQNPGRNYQAGDIGIVDEDEERERDPNKLKGVGGSAKVEETSLAGGILYATIDNAGVNYTEPIDITFRGGNGEGRGRMFPKALVKYSGFYKNNNGKLSSNKRLQDADYYQNYSYVLKAEVSLDTYKDIVKKLIHPAGMKMFGSISLLRSLKTDTPFHSEHQAYEIPIVGHYTPYRPLSTTDLRSNGVTAAGGGPGAGWSGSTGNAEGGQTYGDLYFLGYNPNRVQNYHCFGLTGGKIIVRGAGLTNGSFTVGSTLAGDTSGVKGEVLSFSLFTGTLGNQLYHATGGIAEYTKPKSPDLGGTIGASTTAMKMLGITGNNIMGIVHFLKTPDSNPTGWCGGTAGAASPEYGELVTNPSGTTAQIITILEGSGIVSESLTEGTTLAGIIGHDPANLPLGTAGTEGSTAATNYREFTGLTAYNYWEIYHHPNTRGLSGQYVAGGFTNGIPAGMSFDRVPLKTFLRMPVGEHFHSDPETTSAYYGSPDKEYSVDYGSTSGSPNLSTI